MIISSLKIPVRSEKTMQHYSITHLGQIDYQIHFRNLNQVIENHQRTKERDKRKSHAISRSVEFLKLG